VDAGYFVDAEGASAPVACEAGTYSGAGATACTLCAKGQYAAALGAATCATTTGGQYVGTLGAVSPSTCASGRFSGAGYRFCPLCPLGTTSDEGASSCTKVDAGYVAPINELYEVTTDSALVLYGVDAAALNADEAANLQLQEALETVFVDDMFSELSDSATIASVGPAYETETGATVIPFQLAANYTATAAENVTLVEAQLLADFQTAFFEKASSGELLERARMVLAPKATRAFCVAYAKTNTTTTRCSIAASNARTLSWIR
jgi:hypothetical protein